MTESEPKPKRAMVRRQRRLCPERWAAAMVGAAMVAWQGRSRRIPGQYDQVRGEWMSQDRRPEEHTHASELAMVVTD